MTDQKQLAFEKQKNRKAMAITGAITLALLALSFLSWKLPKLEEPVKEEYVEVDVDFLDLGNSTVGSGDIQPLVPGDYAPETNETEKSPPKADPAPPEPAADPITDDKEDGPEVVKPINRPSTPTTRLPDRVVTNNTNNRPSNTNNNTPATTPTPAPRRPAAVFTRPGGTGPGGNNSDGYNNSRGQGPGNGNGDVGDPNGVPNGTGTRPRLTNANITNMASIRAMSESGTSFKGKVYLKLKVDENGQVTSVIANNPAPFDREAKNFAADLARKIRFNPGADGRTADVTLNFNLGQ